MRDGRQLAPSWKPRVTNSSIADWMPLHTILSLSGQNRITVALSDALTPISISSGVGEYDACLNLTVNFFTMSVSPIKEYMVTLRIDTRDIKYYDSIYDVIDWWEKECGYSPAFVPESAKLPINSLWYSYHQKLDTEDIIKECKLSKEIGMDTVIVDDGWQTDNSSGGYAYCGDWQVAKTKIADMKEFVNAVHGAGMKIMLWYSVPFVGAYAENYERFKDYLLDGTGNNTTFWSLDPRYKEVREFLIKNYITAVKDWGFDGLKLDFIDRFKLSGKSLEFDEKRDFQDLEAAIDKLMTDIKNALTEINSDVLIEFRQTYVGPAIRKYGNMLRVTDCPGDAIMNRQDIANLRLTSGKTAVHSDMLMWNYNEPVENAALQFVSSLYAVPQISVKIADLNNQHKKMLKFYLGFWRENRDVLIEGKFIANNPESSYSQVLSHNSDTAIVTAYTDRIICSNGFKRIIAINSTNSNHLYIKDAKNMSYKVLNCMGEHITSGVINSALEEKIVPLAGMIEIE